MSRLIRRVAPGVTELHSTRCGRSAGKRRCDCQPSYMAEARVHGQRLARTFPTQRDALVWLLDVREARRLGRLPEASRRSAPSVEEFARDFLRRARAGKVLNRSGRPYAAATVEGYEVALRLRGLDAIEPRLGVRLGDLRIDAIDARTVQVAVDEVAAAAGAARARTVGAALATVLADAYARGLRDDPAPRVRLPPPPARRDRLVGVDALERLLAAARADDEKRKRSFGLPLVTLLAATGARISELLAASWGPDGLDLDADPPVLRIASGKTAAATRDVLLDSETVAIMRRHRFATGRPRDGVPVFADERGRPLSRSGRVRSTLRRLAKQAMLPDEKLTPHLFRHAHASELARANVPASAAAARLGHADGGALWLRVYSHASRDDQVAALDALARARKAQKPGVRRAGDEQRRR